MIAESIAARTLSLLPPETAHALSLRLVESGLGGRIAPSADGLRLFGKPVPNLFGLPGGVDKNATALEGWRRLGVGFVEAGTVTPKSRTGNAGPRIWRVGRDAMINWMGLPNVGIDRFAVNLHRFRSTDAGKDYCVGASLHSPDGSRFEMAQMAVSVRGLVDFVTKNASCPNTVEGVADGMGPHAEEVDAIKHAVPHLPVLVKLGPMRDEALLEAIGILSRAGADGFVLCNTAPFAERDAIRGEPPADWPVRDGKRVGGYSGPGLLAVSLRMVATARSHLGPDVVLIGVGGVSSAADARAMTSAGATAVQAYTAIARRGPAALADIASGTVPLRESEA